MAWGLCRKNVSGGTPRAPWYCRIRVGLIRGILGEQPILVLPQVDIGSLAWTYSRCHQRMLKNLRDSFKERPWIWLMSLVRFHRVASYVVAIVAPPILGEKRPQRGYGWSFLRQRSRNDLCIADRSGCNLGENCSCKDLGSKPSEAFLKARILGRGLGLEQIILGPT